MEKSGEEIREFHKGETHLNRQRDLAGSRESMWATSSGGRFPQMELSSAHGRTLRSSSSFRILDVYFSGFLGFFFSTLNAFAKGKTRENFECIGNGSVE